MGRVSRLAGVMVLAALLTGCDCSLRWSDGLGGLSGYSASGPRYIEGEPSFELTLTSEALPATGAHGWEAARP